MTITRRHFAAGLAVLGAPLAVAGRSFAQGDILSRDAVLRDPQAPVQGNPDGDVTIVEYFDYQCPYCKKEHPALLDVVRSDGKVRLVMKDWPIFGAPSKYASELVLAAREQGAYEKAQHALMKTPGKLTIAMIDSELRKAGVDLDRAQRDLSRQQSKIQGLLARNAAQAEAFGLMGTPAFIVSTFMFPGAMDGPGLRQAIADARKAQ